MLRVKICGNRCAGDIQLAARMGADAIGLIVGVRHRSEDALEPARAAELLRSVPPLVTSVLVTHLIAAEEVIGLHRLVPAGAIQLHDAIPIQEVAIIRDRLPFTSLIKAIGVTGEPAIEAARQFAPHVDALLLDTHSGDRIGGTGKVHDWSISRKIVLAVRTPVILAGGLRPENLAQAIEAVRPYGVDVNSGVERPDGEKDLRLVADFIHQAKHPAHWFASHEAQ